MQSWLWLPLALLSAFFASLVAIFGKIGIDKVDSTLATMVRSAVMFVFLLIVTFATGKISGIGNINNKALLFIILAGIAGATSWIFYFWALKVGRATHVATIDRLSIVFVALLAFLILKEKTDVKDLIGLALMVAGSVLVALG